MENISNYDKIASHYDIFNTDFNYSDYFSVIKNNLSSFKNPFGDKIALDCGCGTGSLIEHLLKEGFICTGVDISPDMLAIAKSKKELEDVQFICQNLSEIDLYRAYNLVICSLDTVNHITEKIKLKSFFKKIYNFIEPKGFFIFDVKTEKGFKKNIKTEIYKEKENMLIYEGFYIKPYMEYILTTFSELEDNCFIKNETSIEERFYSDKEIYKMLSISKLKYIRKINYKDRKIYIYRKVL